MQVVVQALNVYPIKSCAGVALSESLITERGLKWDREWVVVTREGQPCTQREWPRMVLIQPRLSDTHLHLAAPGMAPFRISLDVAISPKLPVQIWQDHTSGYDEGDAVAAWFSEFLGVSCRLLRVHPEAQRPLDASAVARWAEQTGHDTQLLQRTQFAFADGFPFLLCNQASLTELNLAVQRQGGKPVGMNRFRANIVISGLEAYEEDYLLALNSPELGFANLKNCARCPMPNVEPLTGLVGAQPGLALNSTRHLSEGVIFGVNLALYQQQAPSIKIGQELTAELSI